MLFYGIGKCLYSSDVSTRIALAILAVQRADAALFYFYGIGKCSYSRGALECKARTFLLDRKGNAKKCKQVDLTKKKDQITDHD